MTSIYTWTAILLGSALLAGCGGEDETASIGRNGDGGLFFGFFQENRTSSDSNPRNIGGLYINVPSANGLYFGQKSFQFDPDCQDRNTLPILGDKTASSLLGAATGQLDRTLTPTADVAFGVSGNYFFDGRSYGGNYARPNITTNQIRDTARCGTKYNLAPNGAWVTHSQGTRFPADFELRQTNSSQITWLPPTSVSATRALVILLDADTLKKPKAADAPPENAFISQVIQPTSATLLNSYTLPLPSTPPKNYVVVVQLLNAGGQLVGFDDLTVRF